MNSISASERSDPVSARQIRGIIVSSSIGNALEWYDFLVYGFFAPLIAKLFFPAHDAWISLLLAIGSFGISFLTRPIGAIVLGVYADRKGRRASLSVSIMLMTFATLVIAIMPTYGQIGLAAPMLILAARLVQGFAVGGEFGSATAFMVEHSPSRRGYFASWQFASQGLAAITASAVGGLLTNWLSPAQLEGWGWRLPFVFGLLVGPVGYYIRRHLDETPEFLAEKKRATPAGDVLFRNQMGNLVLAVGVVAQSTVLVYVLQLYMPTYAVQQLGLPVAQSFGVVLLNGTLQFLLSPVMGALSDRIGRVRIMLTASVAVAITIYPMFYWLRLHPTVGWLLALQALAGVFKAAYSGPMPALMSEIFPTRSRSTGLSLAYSLGVTLFGGFAPLFVTGFIGLTGDKLAPSYYVLLAAVVSSLSLVVIGKAMKNRPAPG